MDKLHLIKAAKPNLRSEITFLSFFFFRFGACKAFSICEKKTSPGL
jgi:hypothetical protein